jgi:hypothetical protein
VSCYSDERTCPLYYPKLWSQHLRCEATFPVGEGVSSEILGSVSVLLYGVQFLKGPHISTEVDARPLQAIQNILFNTTERGTLFPEVLCFFIESFPTRLGKKRTPGKPYPTAFFKRTNGE